MPNVTQWLASLPKHEIRGPSLKCTQLAGTDATTTLSKSQASQDTEIVQKQHSHDERHQEQRHGEEEEGRQVDDHLEVTDNIGVRDGGDELAKFGVLACHRRMASTTPDLHSNPWGLVVLPRPLRLTLHLGARHFLNASIASDAFDSRTKHTRPLMACRAQRTAKSIQTNCIRPITTRSPRVHHVFPCVFATCFHVFTTCSLRVYHVFTTCLPRVYHVFTTCSPRVYHVFTTCSPRVYHVFTTCSPRVHHVSHLVW